MSAASDETQLQISEVIRRVHEALVESESRDELETAVCRVFARSDPYVFAWIGALNPETDVVEPRTIAGENSGYLDAISIDLSDPEQSRGPTATAIRTGETQIMQRIREDPNYEPWREQALEHGFESSAAVPLVENDSATGVLNVYSERPDAFDESERLLLTELGVTIGTAISETVARRELETQKRQYERLTERISDAFYAVDAEWKITYWNDRIVARTDIAAEDVLGKQLWTVLPEIAGTEIEARYRTAMTTNEPQSFETYVEDPIGSWVEIDVYPDEDGLSIFSREINERKRREEELTRAKRRLDAIVHNTSESIYIKTLDGRYSFINDVGAATFGLTPEAVVGKTDEELFDPESATSIRADDRYVVETESAETWERVRYVDGREHVFIDNKFPFYDEDDEIGGIVGVSRDITDRKAYERQLEEQRDGLDLLNKVVRHDIRNNLQIVLGYGEMLEEHVDGEGETHLQKVLTNAESAVELTHTAADLAAVMVSPERVPIEMSLDTVLQMQIAELRESFDEATVTVDGSLPSVAVLADEMLSSVFRNLLKNAVQHNDKAQPTVTVSTQTDADTVTVRIADNGPGIPASIRSSIFGQGEKGLGSEGTGVGLYLVRKLVEAYGGEVWLDDGEEPRLGETDDGAVFAVKLPRA